MKPNANYVPAKLKCESMCNVAEYDYHYGILTFTLTLIMKLFSDCEYDDSSVQQINSMDKEGERIFASLCNKTGDVGGGALL